MEVGNPNDGCDDANYADSKDGHDAEFSDAVELQIPENSQREHHDYSTRQLSQLPPAGATHSSDR